MSDHLEFKFDTPNWNVPNKTVQDLIKAHIAKSS